VLAPKTDGNGRLFPGIDCPPAESYRQGTQVVARRTVDPTEVGRFEATVLPHLDAAYTLARYLLHNEDDAKDVVQDAYLRALKYLGSAAPAQVKAAPGCWPSSATLRSAVAAAKATEPHSPNSTSKCTVTPLKMFTPNPSSSDLMPANHCIKPSTIFPSNSVRSSSCASWKGCRTRRSGK